jgi:lysozyme family protein
MANHAVMIDWIKKWEGGISRAKTDTASKNVAPNTNGVHTNKGVTWETFNSLSSRLNYQPTTKLFLEMPDYLWERIYKKGYWDAVKGDEINSQAIANVLVDWAWGAGSGRAIENTKRFLNNEYKANLIVNSTIDRAFVNAINSAASQNEKLFFDKFSQFKMKWYMGLSNQEANKKGWANRLNDLYRFSLQFVGYSDAGNANTPLIAVALLTALIFV